MDNILKENDLVTIDGGVKFLVMKTFSYNNDNYGYLCQISQLDQSNPQFVIAKEVEVGDDCSLQILTTEEEISPLLPIIKNLYES